MQYATNQLKIPYRACNGVVSLLFNTLIQCNGQLIDKIALTWGDGIIKFVHNVMICLIELVNFVQVIDKTNREGFKPSLETFIKFTHKSIITETTGC